MLRILARPHPAQQHAKHPTPTTHHPHPHPRTSYLVARLALHRGKLLAAAVGGHRKHLELPGVAAQHAHDAALDKPRAGSGIHSACVTRRQRQQWGSLSAGVGCTTCRPIWHQSAQRSNAPGLPMRRSFSEYDCVTVARKSSAAFFHGPMPKSLITCPAFRHCGFTRMSGRCSCCAYA